MVCPPRYQTISNWTPGLTLESDTEYRKGPSSARNRLLNVPGASSASATVVIPAHSTVPVGSLWGTGGPGGGVGTTGGCGLDGASGAAGAAGCSASQPGRYTLPRTKRTSTKAPAASTRGLLSRAGHGCPTSSSARTSALSSPARTQTQVSRFAPGFRPSAFAMTRTSAGVAAKVVALTRKTPKGSTTVSSPERGLAPVLSMRSVRSRGTSARTTPKSISSGMQRSRAPPSGLGDSGVGASPSSLRPPSANGPGRPGAASQAPAQTGHRQPPPSRSVRPAPHTGQVGVLSSVAGPLIARDRPSARSRPGPGRAPAAGGLRAAPARCPRSAPRPHGRTGRPRTPGARAGSR